VTSDKLLNRNRTGLVKIIEQFNDEESEFIDFVNDDGHGGTLGSLLLYEKDR
jgi:hypothetical protein